MKTRKLAASVFATSFVLFLLLIPSQAPMTVAQERNQSSQPTPQPNVLPPTPIPNPNRDEQPSPALVTSPSSAPSNIVIDVPLDIVLLQDETGSMGDDIGALRALAPQIWDSIAAVSTAGFRMSVAGFGDYARSPWGSSSDSVYRLTQNFTTSRDAFTNGVGILKASGGNDTPESQYPALYYTLTPSHPCIDTNGDGDCSDRNDTPIGQQPSFRSGAKRIILLATDAPFHAPETTPRYPGPSGDTVRNALRATNTAVIGLVPGGAGRIAQVDDLALQTGGSVQNTGSSGQDVAQAIAQAIGEFGSVPGTDGSLSLTISSPYTIAQPIVPSLQVSNPTRTGKTYTVRVSLRRDSTTINTVTRDITVSGGASTSLNDISFGIQPSGSYQVEAELLLGTSRLQVRGPLSLQVLRSAGQEKAITEGAKLKDAANTEIDEMIDIVAKRYGDSLGNASADIISFLTGSLITKLDPVAKSIVAGSITSGDVNKAITRVALRIGEIPTFIKDGIVGPPVERLAKNSLSYNLAPERAVIASRQQLFDTVVAGRGDVAWTEDMGNIVSRYRETILNRVEAEPITGFQRVIVPGETTLKAEDATFGFYQDASKYLGIAVVIASIAILLLAAIGSAPGTLGASIVAFLGALPILIVKFLTAAKLVIATGLIIFAITMYTQVQTSIAPAVSRDHSRGLDTLSDSILRSTGTAFGKLSTDIEVQGRKALLSTHVTNIDSAPARPLVETYLYSVDGRVVDILSHQPTLGDHETRTLHGTTTLLPGRYKAVTALHTQDQIGLASQTSAVEVSSPAVDLSASLDNTRLSLNQAVTASIVLTNTHTFSSTGDLAVLADPGEGLNLKTWTVNLAPGAIQRLEYTFVPQTVGGDRLRVSVTDGMSVLANSDTAYAVGDSAAIAINTTAQDVYSPATDVTIPLQVTNAGNQAIASSLSLITFDELRNFPVYTDTRTLKINPEATIAVNATSLPAALAQPGLYTVQVLLDGELYTTLDFAVAAEDTLFTTINPDFISHNLGDTVPLTVTVSNSSFVNTDAEVSAVLWRPDGITETVELSRVATGQYRGSVATPIDGTYLATVEAHKPRFRVVNNNTFFTVSQPSQLQSTVEGRFILGENRPVTVTVRNERGTPVQGVTLAISSTLEYLSSQTDAAGQAVLQLAPTITTSYQVSLEKLGFAQTELDLPVFIAPDVTPPTLFINVPSLTNSPLLTVTGVTEADATLMIDEQNVAVDAAGQFTTTLALTEGSNLLAAVISDAVSNTLALTRTVILDTAAPVLTVTDPVLNFETFEEVVRITGTTELSSTVVVSGTLAEVDTTNGVFSALVLLQPGANNILVTATDEAGNSTTVTRSVFRRLASLALLPSTDGKLDNPGKVVTYTLQVTNTGNISDTYDVTFSGNAWPTVVPATVGVLEASATATFVVTVAIPSNVSAGIGDTVMVMLTSRADTTKVATSELTTTADPHRVLLPFIRR